jgi:hypothetical protein
MKHILYFAGYKMVVMRWQHNAFTGVAEFDPDEKGYTAFERLITGEVKKPLKILVDIIEEDIRLETSPHLVGRDRMAMHQRLKNRYFRQYAHTYLYVQGRSNENRRNDVVFLSSLTNPKLLQPWLDILHKTKAPLEGIYSLPLVGESLLKSLGATKQNALVISQQVPSSIRQSYYADGKLKLSRLAPADDDSNSWYTVLRDETNRTVRYLENQHYVDTKKKLHIYVIAPGREHEGLNAELKSDTRKEFHFLDKDRLAYELGIKSMLPGQYSYWLYAQLLLAGRYRKVHYYTHTERKYFYHYEAAKWMWTTAIAVVAGLGLWSLILFLDGFGLESKRDSIIAETAKYQSLYEEIVADIAALNLNIGNVRDAVDAVNRIKQRSGAMPLEFMRIVSAGLGRHPRVEIKEFKWVSTDDSNHSFGEDKPALDRRIQTMVQLGRTSFNYEKVLLTAVVTNYQNNPRIAVEEAQRFANDLRNMAKDLEIEIIKMPFDVDPASRMVGQSFGQSINGKSNDAEFSVVLIRKTEHNA